MFKPIGVWQCRSDQVSFWSHYSIIRDANLP
jgi:hypothetical protein